MRARLENWSLVTKRIDLYRAPELGILVMEGLVYDHPEHQDGKSIITSEVQRSEGRIVWTYNTEYELGTVNPDYKKWLIETHGKDLDEENPVKLTH